MCVRLRKSPSIFSRITIIALFHPSISNMKNELLFKNTLIAPKEVLYSNLNFLQIDNLYLNGHKELIFSLFWSKMNLELMKVSKLFTQHLINEIFINKNSKSWFTLVNLQNINSFDYSPQFSIICFNPNYNQYLKFDWNLNKWCL